MSSYDQDRRLVRRANGERGEFGTVLMPVHGNTQIYKGDLLFQDRVDGLRTRGASTADNYVYPFSKVSGVTSSLASNILLAAANFAGVAAWHSDSGTTENLFVYMDHQFIFNLKNARSVKTMYRVIPAGSGTTLYNQMVNIDKSGTTTKYIGVATNGGNLISNVEFQLITLFQPEYRLAVW